MALINISNPAYIKSVLEGEVLRNTRELVAGAPMTYSQDQLVDLFQVIDEIEFVRLNVLALQDDARKLPHAPFEEGTIVHVGADKTDWEVVNHARGERYVVVKQVDSEGREYYETVLENFIRKVEATPAPSGERFYGEKLVDDKFSVGDSVIVGKYGRIEWTILEIQGERVRLEATLENGDKRFTLSSLGRLKKSDKTPKLVVGDQSVSEFLLDNIKPIAPKPFKLGKPVTVGKGKTVWLVMSYDGDMVRLERTLDNGKIRHSTALVEQLKAVKY